MMGPSTDITNEAVDLNVNNFELRYSLKAFDKIPVSEYVSTATGLTVVLAEVDGPIVSGYFVLATEAYDDDGLPHTLEHLVFLGSENYPFKGVLDLLANRCLASGTNAWTDTDHTCYTVETAGSSGFLSILPIYLEHILYPTLADEAFVTEVHHITETGDDAGVVYCEMQGRENAAESKLKECILRNLYPGHCGYSSEVGGIMKNLRESTNNTKVRDFHRAFYRPENLKVMISGQIKAEDVFRALAPVEAQIISKGPRETFKRPWQCSIPDMTEPKDLVVEYPADEETNGLFATAWRGPSIVNEYYTVQGIQYLLKYLTELPTSPLPKEFVEVDDPYGSKTSFDTSEYAETYYMLILEDVPVSKLPEVGPKLKELLKSIVDNMAIDMVQLHSILKKSKVEMLSSLENSPHRAITMNLIGQMLYGHSQEDLEKRINPIQDITKLLDEPKHFWLDLLDKYLVNNKKAIYVQCKPSIQRHQTMAQEEKERVTQQINNLKNEGLLEKKELLNNSIAHNERLPPAEMLTSVPIPEISSIKYHHIERFNSDSEPNDRIDLSNTPVFTYFDHLETNFVYVNATLDTSTVPSHLKIYLPLLLNTILEVPIERDGQIIPYDVVVALLNDDTISNGSSLGLRGSGAFCTGNFSSTASVVLQLEAEKYETGFRWLGDILYKSVFTAERLKVIANKMNNSVSQFKRDGSNVMLYAMQGLRFVEDSNIIKNGVLQQSRFLTEVISKLESGNGDEVIQNLEAVRKIITDPANVVLYIAGNLNILKDPVKAIDNFLPIELNEIIKQEKLNVTPDYKLLKDANDDINGCIIGMGSLESSFFMQTTQSITSRNDPDFPAIKVLLNYLCQLEGPLWKNIRGKGFAYGYSITVRPSQGLLYLQFYRATNVIGAYKETKAIVDKQLTYKDWDESLLASAKSSLIFEIINQEKVLSSVADLSFMSNFYGADFIFNRKLLEHINEVTTEDLNRVGAKYLAALFDPDRVKTAVVTHPAKVADISANLKEMGLHLNTYNSLEESFLNKM